MQTFGITMNFRTGWIRFPAFGLYFGFLLVYKAFPAIRPTGLAFVYTLSTMAVIPLLILLAVWSVAALVGSRLRKRPLGRRSRAAGHVAAAGISAFAIVLALSKLLPDALPSGSHDDAFSREAWLNPSSTDYVSGQATPRQKMLAEVIARLPLKRRDEIETLLGPSLDTPYFKDSGRDLIYITGPERDSYFPVDSEWLLIWLDEKDVYQGHAIVTD